MNSFAFWTHRELVWIAGGHPDFTAQGDDGASSDRALDDFILADVVGELVVIAFIEEGSGV